MGMGADDHGCKQHPGLFEIIGEPGCTYDFWDTIHLNKGPSKCAFAFYIVPAGRVLAPEFRCSGQNRFHHFLVTPAPAEIARYGLLDLFRSRMKIVI